MILKKAKENTKNLILQTHKLKSPPIILLGLSGGPDSVFLFHLLKELHNENFLTLLTAHLDHEWRTDSHKDLIFCENLCKKHNISNFSLKAKSLKLNLKFNGSQEEMGRKLRRYFLEKTLKESNGNYIALAHHQQDQHETFLLRIIRGTSLSGLVGMKEINGKYLRPLLKMNKKEVLKYLHENKIEYLKDETNSSDKYLRNRIRKYILPAFTKCDPRADEKFESTLQNLKEADQFLQKTTEMNFQTIFQLKQSKDAQTKTYYVGDLSAFQKQDNFLKKQLIMLWLIKENVNFIPSKAFLNEIIRFLSSEHGGSHTTGSTWKINKKRTLFWLEKAANLN